MKKLLFKVYGYIGNPYELKLTLRNYSKIVVPDVYFRKFSNQYEIKNIGCLIFGQPDVWASILYFIPKDNGGSIDILLDEWRFNLVSGNISIKEVIEILDKTLKGLESRNLIDKYEKVL